MKLAGGAVVACITAVLCCTTATSQTPQTHRFTPTTFYNTYSFAHPPALRIKPGDRVVTKTIDAAGIDWNGKSVATGRIRRPDRSTSKAPSRATCWSSRSRRSKRIARRRIRAACSRRTPSTPQAIAARVDREAKRVTWTIDKAKGVARLDSAEHAAGGIEAAAAADARAASASRRRARKPSRRQRPAPSAATWTTRS